MLDGEQVAIKGAKDEYSQEPTQESSSLLNILGGSRSYDISVNRSLPINTICQVLGNKLGVEVPPNSSGVNGALARIFGGNAGKLMCKLTMLPSPRSWRRKVGSVLFGS